MLVYKTSGQTASPPKVCMTSDNQTTDEQIEKFDINISSYVSCVYDAKWWVRIIDEISDECRDYKVKFMYSYGPTRQYHWPHMEERCWIPEEDILCVIEPPFQLVTSSSSRK